MSTAYTLITGASSGLGEATARLLSETRNVLLSGRNIERLTAVAEACSGNFSVEIFPYDLSEVQNLSQDLKAFLKQKEIVVNEFAHFAGDLDLLPMAKTKYSVGQRVMNVNYFSATEIVSTLLKKRVNQKALKTIVFIGSIVAKTGTKYLPHYCASKGAIEALTRALAIELAPNVRVNCIAPGSFNTNIVRTTFVDPDAPFLPPTLVPMKGVEQVANVTKFLFSSDSEYIAGQVLDVDGGERFFGVLNGG